MEPLEILGILVLLLAFLIPAIRKSSRQRKVSQQLSPQERARLRQEQEAAQAAQYEQFLRAMGATEEADLVRQRRLAQQKAAAPTPLPPTVERQPAPPHPVEEISQRELPHLHSKIEGKRAVVSKRLVAYEPEAAYRLDLEVRSPRIQELLAGPLRLQDLVLAREILDRPLGERNGRDW